MQQWVEETDPQKHVFEDIGIACFLICMWNSSPPASAKPTFVDVGCGNGLLTHILNSEGYRGYGM